MPVIAIITNVFIKVAINKVLWVICTNKYMRAANKQIYCMIIFLLCIPDVISRVKIIVATLLKEKSKSKLGK